MPKLVLIAVLFFAAAPVRALDGSAVIARVFTDAQLRGEATFRWLGLPLYTARLFTPGGQALAGANPVGLELIYARNITRQSLVNATVSELERLEGSQADHGIIGQKLAPCFRDVTDGDRFVATATKANELQVFFNGARTCRISHEKLGARFLNIWLSQNSRSPALSRQLRGG